MLGIVQTEGRNPKRREIANGREEMLSRIAGEHCSPLFLRNPGRRGQDFIVEAIATAGAIAASSLCNTAQAATERECLGGVALWADIAFNCASQRIAIRWLSGSSGEMRISCLLSWICIRMSIRCGYT